MYTFDDFSETDLDEHAKALRRLRAPSGFAQPGAAISGDVTASPIPIPTTDSAALRSLDFSILHGQGWKNDASGYSFED